MLGHSIEILPSSVVKEADLLPIKKKTYILIQRYKSTYSSH